jgi:hypothetical protein
MKLIITAVVFFFVGKYFEKIKVWWKVFNPTNKDKLGDN